MAKIPRKNQKIFAGSAANNGQFGSAQLGTKVTSTDLDVLQALAAYGTGWLDAVIGTKKFPTLEEFQALSYIETTQLAYLFQEGIPEWNTSTNYFTHSIVKKTGTYEIYGSLTDDNQGNALTDATKWVLLQDLSNPVATSSDIGMIKAFGGTSVPTGFLACDGSSLLRATYPDLFTAIGTTWGSADGTHFTVPNLNRRALMGSGGSGTGTIGNAVGDTGGEEAHAQTSSEMAAHHHGVNIATGSAASSTFPATDPSTSAYAIGTDPGTDTQGSGTAANVIQPSAIVKFCIQYQ